MTIPYRTQQALKRTLLLLLALAVLLVVACACWFLWLQRYLVYTAEGDVRLDFNLPPISEGQLAEPPDTTDIPIRFDNGESIADSNTELTQMLGYYVERTDLQDIDSVIAQIQALPPETAKKF